MDLLPILVAALAAGAILLIVVGLTSSSPVDPVQARLTQLGTMQAKNLEELELQAPFIERTLRPLAQRLSGRMSLIASSSFTERTEKRLALAGNPGALRVSDWLGVKAIGAIVGGILFFFLFVILGVLCCTVYLVTMTLGFRMTKPLVIAASLVRTRVSSDRRAALTE